MSSQRQQQMMKEKQILLHIFLFRLLTGISSYAWTRTQHETALSTLLGLGRTNPLPFKYKSTSMYNIHIYQNGVPFNKDYLKVLQRWLGLWGLDGFTKLHSNKILKEYEKLKYLLHIFLLNKSKNKSGGCQIPLSPYHRQTWNLSKNLHDPIFGRKNFTHWKCVNGDYFRQQ